MKSKFNNLIIILGLIIALSIFISSCKKEWLEAKPKQDLVVPETPSDLLALLDNDVSNIEYPTLGELASDDYYVDDDYFSVLPNRDQNIYTWSNAKDFYAGQGDVDWQVAYNRIFNMNLVLEKVSQQNRSSELTNQIKGSALFFRGMSFFGLASTFSKPYNAETASHDLGVVLRLVSNINIPAKRASLKETFNRVLQDLQEAIELLPSQAQYKTRPTKSAALALLSRVYLYMGDFENALKYSTDCLKSHSLLNDFNALSVFDPSNYRFTFDKYDQEVILFARAQYETLLPEPFGLGSVSSDLYNSYEMGDLRKSIFFFELNGRLVYVGGFGDMGVFFFQWFLQ
uniref:RagB/SusD family nutrient uptake outer membrane protein n=1 Tax=Pedobacter schmidteae TaxID=2201271 RepID=UPI000EABC990|nr:RagB/SusD family nutrient uptake outer membrane protein [Pedobacter schmidteae]